MFEILTKLTTVTTGKKSDQNVSLFCCVVLFDDWYRCNETSSNTIIECNKRGTVAETLLPSLYVTWLIIAVANEYARSHRTNIHSELDAANEARRCRCRCSRPAHSHIHTNQFKYMHIASRALAVKWSAIVSPSRFQSGRRPATHPKWIQRNSESYSFAVWSVERSIAKVLGTASRFLQTHTDTHTRSTLTLSSIKTDAHRFVRSLSLQLFQLCIRTPLRLQRGISARGRCVDAVIYFAQKHTHILNANA